MNPLADSRKATKPLLKKPQFSKFAEVITRELGIKMPEAKGTMLSSRINKRLQALDLPDIDAYQNFLFNTEAGKKEMTHFFDVVTTNKTDFFRESRHFDYLRDSALPTLDPDPNAPWRLKLWCAGCSSGEETYTQAIVLSEFGRSRGNFDFSILGTDISSTVLDKAKTAIYREDRIQPIPLELRKRYLLKSSDPSRRIIRIVPELRNRVAFSRLNFMDTNYSIHEKFDVIFFRNVMIYFDRPTQQAVVRKLCQNLKPGGYLFTGHSESLSGLDLPIETIGTSVYRRI